MQRHHEPSTPSGTQVVLCRSTLDAVSSWDLAVLEISKYIVLGQPYCELPGISSPRDQVILDQLPGFSSLNNLLSKVMS